MKISDEGKGIKSIDSKYKAVYVVFNASKKSMSFTGAGLAKAKISLHPALKTGADATVKSSKFLKGVFTVPGVTTAVFVQK
jgi:signal transduction histidine kinase